MRTVIAVRGTALAQRSVRERIFDISTVRDFGEGRAE
jgi:hypothetical protein